MTALARLRRGLARDPGRALLVLALLAGVVIYAPTLDRGLVNLDDSWLYTDNYLVRHPSWSSVATIFTDLHSTARLALGAEYLPVRDLSVLADYAAWGTWYPGFHLTNLGLYLAAIALLWATLEGFGVDRVVVGVATLLWAVHPAHAESVAWLSERKGLLAVALVLLAGLGYARFRAGRHPMWLVLATCAGVAAVWSKAPAAFGLAGLAALEVALPARRVSWRRSLRGLAAIGLIALVAFVPVLIVAHGAGVVATAAPHGSRLAIALGGHGFYVRLAGLASSSSISYPILTGGPSTFDVALGAIALAAIVAAVLAPARWRVPAEVRAGAALWLLGWLPASHLVLALQHVVADRYLMLPSLGLALAAAALLVRVRSPRLRPIAIAAVALVAAGRAFVAQGQWESELTLWQAAIVSDPDDGRAWSGYALALAQRGRPDLAAAAVDEGLGHVPDDGHLALRKALLLIDAGARDAAMPWLRRAADAREPAAMANLALLLLEDGHGEEALGWARQAALAAPALAHAQRTHGKIALAAHQPAEARAAFERALALEPTRPTNHYNLALALLALGEPAAARRQLDACAREPTLAAPVAAARAEAERQLAAPPAPVPQP